MTVILNDVAARNDYVASAGQTVFPLTFKFFAASDLLVFQNGVLKTLTANYSAQGAGLDTGMQITLAAGATLGDKLAIIRAVPYARTADLPLTGPFPVASLNTMLAKIVAMAQQLRDKANAALTNDVASNSFLDATTRRISNVVDPASPQDAATKNYVDTQVTPFVTAAAGSATAAAASALAASNAMTATLNAYDSFDDRYLGQFASNPTLDNDGNALVAGTIFYKTGAGAGMYVWTGTQWLAAYVDGTLYLPLSGGVMTGPISARALTMQPDQNNTLGIGRYSLAYGGAAIDAQGGSTFMSMQLGTLEIFRYNASGVTIVDGKWLAWSDVILKRVSAGKIRVDDGAGNARDIEARTVFDGLGNVRVMPFTAQRTAAYVASNSDVGQTIPITTGGVTVNTGVFVANDIFSIYNESDVTQTLTQGTGVTMRKTGTASSTGNQTIPARGVVTVLMRSSTEALVMGMA